MADRTCSVDKCVEPAHVRGWCTRHYGRWRRWGSVDVVRSPGVPARPIIDRIAEALDFDGPDGCWLWTGGKNRLGYGRVVIRKNPRLVYRVLWEEVVGPVPDGLELDHLCRNPTCCNPDHLEPVTHHVNVLRGESPSGRNARKTHCLRGHGFTAENTYVTPTGARQCRICNAMRRKGPVPDAYNRGAAAA